MSNRPPDKPGLQAERTLLSWERSAFGFLVGGALVLLRQHGPLQSGRLALAVIAGMLALSTLWLGYRRSRCVAHVKTATATPHVSSPRLEVMVLGWGTALFAAALVTVMLVFH